MNTESMEQRTASAIFDSLSTAQQQTLLFRAFRNKEPVRVGASIPADGRIGSALERRGLVIPAWRSGMGTKLHTDKPLAGDHFYGYKLTEHGAWLLSMIQASMEEYPPEPSETRRDLRNLRRLVEGCQTLGKVE